jgi:predicted nuclease of predicted toxin-antitoxin system
MNIYLDEDASNTVLIQLLRKAGHNLQTTAEAGMLEFRDASQLAHAIRQSRVLLTKNQKDFEALDDLARTAMGHHPGIVIVCQDNDPSRDMTSKGIVNAIANLESSGISLADQAMILNHWR